MPSEFWTRWMYCLFRNNFKWNDVVLAQNSWENKERKWLYKCFAIRKVITAAKSEVVPGSQYALLLPGAEVKWSDEIGQVSFSWYSSSIINLVWLRPGWFSEIKAVCICQSFQKLSFPLRRNMANLLLWNANIQRLLFHDSRLKQHIGYNSGFCLHVYPCPGAPPWVCRPWTSLHLSRNKDRCLSWGPTCLYSSLRGTQNISSDNYWQLNSLS